MSDPSGTLLIALDFDGTIAAIRRDPDDVAIDPRFEELLCRAASWPRIVVAIVSGRDVDDLRSRAGAVRAYFAGSHGLDVIGPDGSAIRSTPPAADLLDPALAAHVVTSGMRIERKRHGVAVHWRDVARNDGVIARFVDSSRARGLEIIEGRSVVEARVAGARKEDVLRFIAERAHASRVVYAGDDLTDFAALQSADLGLFLRSAERAAPAGVETVGSREELLEALEEEVRKLR